MDGWANKSTFSLGDHCQICRRLDYRCPPANSTGNTGFCLWDTYACTYVPGCSSLWARLHLLMRTAQRLEVLLIACQTETRFESPSRDLHMEHRCRRVRSRRGGARGGLSFGSSASVIKLSHVRGRWSRNPLCVCIYA